MQCRYRINVDSHESFFATVTQLTDDVVAKLTKSGYKGWVSADLRNGDAYLEANSPIPDDLRLSLFNRNGIILTEVPVQA